MGFFFNIISSFFSFGFPLSSLTVHLVCLFQGQFNNPETPGYVGFANLPNQVHRKSVKKGFEFTLMVVGECVVAVFQTFPHSSSLLSSSLWGFDYAKLEMSIILSDNTVQAPS